MEDSSSFYYGSIDVTEVIARLKAGHSSFTKAKTKKGDRVFMSVKMWVNKEPNSVGNHASIQMNANEKDTQANRDEKIYIGNLKYSAKGSGEPVDATEGASLVKDAEKIADDLPF